MRFGVDQSIPVGDASILYTRFAGNFTEFIPLNLFGFNEGSRTLVLNVQAGTMIGDVPPYDAFNLGGASSVRGYRKGRLAAGGSFVQTTAEYRFPIFSFTALRYNFDVGGTLFFDYGTDFGTAGEVIGKPGRVRNKPGDGFGYGFGLRTRSPFGLVRLEFGLNDRGDGEVYFELGGRF